MKITLDSWKGQRYSVYYLRVTTSIKEHRIGYLGMPSLPQKHWWEKYFYIMRFSEVGYFQVRILWFGYGFKTHVQPFNPPNTLRGR